MSSCKMAILGAGNLGTTLALMMWEKGHGITLWTIEEDVAEAIRQGRENPRYLPGHYIPPEIEVSMEIGPSLDGAEAVALAVPSHAVRTLAGLIAAHVAPGIIV